MKKIPSTLSILVERVWMVLRAFPHTHHFLFTVYVYATHTFKLFSIRHILRQENKNFEDFNIGFYPHTPLPIYSIWGTCACLGITPRVSQEAQNIVLFMDKTDMRHIPLPKEARHWINGRCIDIRKSSIATLYTSVFGEKLRVDPTSFYGEVVEKSEENGLHDGRIVQCPIQQPTAGKIYCILVNNLVSENTVEDLRAVIVKRNIVHVYVKQRPRSKRFANWNSAVQVRRAEEVFSEKEIVNLLAFSEAVGLDFGELDVLRDVETKQIYVVDVNKTSTSPPIILPFVQRLACLKEMARALRSGA